MDIKKPCPFCGSNNLSIHRDFDYVQCEMCHCAGPMFDGHLIDAIDGWNTQQSHSQGYQEGEASGIKKGLLKAVEVVKERIEALSHDIPAAVGGHFHDPRWQVVDLKIELEALIKEGK
jgi:hypothetical protein